MSVTYSEYEHSRACLEASYLHTEPTRELDAKDLFGLVIATVNAGTGMSFGIILPADSELHSTQQFASSDTAEKEPTEATSASATQRPSPELRDVEEGFRSRLLASLFAEPVEAGETHPAEEILLRGLEEYRHYATEWIQAAFVAVLLDRPAVAADLLRCLSRVDLAYFPAIGRSALVQAALRSESADLREAAVFAIENWGDSQLAMILAKRVHDESVSWLKGYARAVVREFGIE